MKKLSKHSQLQDCKKSKKLRNLFLLVYILFLLSIILNNGLSKFKRTYANQATLSIAKIIANVVCEDSTTIENLHNEYVTLNFTVTNYNGDKLTTTDINSVKAKYKLEVNKGVLTNIQYVIYKIENEVTTEVDLVNDEFVLSNQEIQEDNYCINLKTTDNINQKDLVGNIKINVIATQIME